MSIGTDVEVDADIDANANLNTSVAGSLGLNLNGIPNNFDLGVKSLPKLMAQLDPLDLGVRVKELPKLLAQLDPLELAVRLKELPKIKAQLDPLDFSFRFKEIPSVRVHFPSQFKLGFALFGREFFSISLCGQAQVITEPYEPNPCEQVKMPAELKQKPAGKNS